MKTFLVFHEKNWMKNELDPVHRAKKSARFVFARYDFRDAPIIKTKQGNKIDDNWLRREFKQYIDAYDGIFVLLDGERLKGRHGLHSKKRYHGKRFSVVQMECKKGMYREWEQRRNKTWYLKLTKRRKKGSIKQIVYTFEHELGHALCWLNQRFDTLHLFVRYKKWELWWDVMKF